MPAEIDYKPLMKDALLKLDELQNRLHAAQRAAAEPIAIIGMGCRFPGGADTPDAFWELLRAGRSAVTEVPPDRFDIGKYYDADPDAPGKIYSRHGSFLAQVDRFDAPFFGISPREAAQMDPQQRLLLETSWEALERAGIAPPSLAGSRTAVIVGMMNQDYAQIAAQSPDSIDVHTGAGTTMSAAAGRLAYFLGLRGPSFVVDTACSSSLVSVHLACQSLRTGECELALAGGVNLILSPVNSVIESRTRILSPDGRCKTFDASGDGIVRGEGCGVVVLRRLSDALAAGDPVVALIRGSAVNHDGRTSALSVPNGPSQEAVVRQALAGAGVSPGDVSYVEAHGTGTTLGDPIEVEALGNVFGPQRAASDALVLGSVKTNLGHLEGAAGICGLIKVALALQHEYIPPHLHFTTPSPLIAWDALPIRVCAEGIAWPRGPRRRIAGVSSFGFTGTNAHAILEEAPAVVPAPEQVDRTRHALTLSAKSAQVLREMAGQYAVFARAHPEVRLADVCYTANTGRAHFPRRLAVDAGSMQELAERLEVYARGADPAPGIEPTVAEASLPGRKIVLPTYPFERCRYWLDIAQSAGHPLLGTRQVSAALKNGEVVFAAELSSDSPAFIGHHRIFDIPVLPAVAYIEMALSAAAAVMPTATAVLEDLRILQALPLRCEGRQLVNTVMRPVFGGRYEFEVYSFNSEKAEWTLHASGSLWGGQSWPQPPFRRPEPAESRLRAELPAPLEAHYQRCRESGLEYGPRFRATERLWKGDGVAYLEAALPDLCRTEAGVYRIHPALLDACFQVFLAAFPEPTGDSVYLPVAVERFTLYRAHCERLQSYGRIRPYKAGDQTIRADIRLLDADGSLVGEVEGLTVRAARREALRRALRPAGDDFCYSVGWHAAPAAPATRETPMPDHWLIFAGDDATGIRLGERLREDGTTCDVFSAADIDRALNGPEQSRGIVYFPRCGGVLQLVQAIARSARPDLFKLWLVTRGAQPVRGSAEIVDVWQALLWGLIQTLALEHPEIDFVACDVDAAEALLCELHSATNERHVAYRGGVRYAARLERLSVSPGRGPAPVIRADASYLIAGGLGGLGLLTADWLVRRGARHLILLGRSAPTAAAADEIARLEQTGASVAAVRCDITDSEALARVLARVDPPLRGVVHCAGVLDDAILLNQDEASFQRVMAPKVRGAWNLHEQTRGADLDFFICYSSVASMVGAQGQANYAAANAFLDALAHHRHALGLPATSVNWGSWPDVGMTSRAKLGAHGSSTVPGLGTIGPARAFTTLELLLEKGLAQTGVFAMDWPKFFDRFPWLERAPFFAECRPATPQATASFLDEMQAHRFEEWPELLEAHAATHAARVLRLDNVTEIDRRARLFDLGLDSLMAVELRNSLAASLGCSLQSTVVFDYPTVELLARHLLETLPGRPHAQEPLAKHTLESVSLLSDRQIELLVEEELKVLANGAGA